MRGQIAMQFNQQQTIYLQIVDYICEKILRKEWQDSERIPAVREMAIDVQVNPNTVVRSYAHLEEKQIIFKQRGIGYFIAEDAREKVLTLKKTDFLKYEVPALLKKMELLGIHFNEIETQGTVPRERELSPEKKQTLIVKSSPKPRLPIEKLIDFDTKTETKTAPTQDLSSDKSMSWD